MQAPLRFLQLSVGDGTEVLAATSIHGDIIDQHSVVGFDGGIVYRYSDNGGQHLAARCAP
jgi:hypothetical protein